MKTKTSLVLTLCGVLALSAMALYSSPADAKGRGSGPIIYVTSQDLFYDSIVTADPLPQHGPFQLLEMAGPTGLQTEYGHGDQQYVGGRWWVDVNGDTAMDAGDHYFSCPLLGPGREEP